MTEVVWALVIDALTCAELYFVCDLKAAQMNVKHSPIQKNMIYKFKLGHYAAAATKNICCVKGERLVDNCTVIRWFKMVYFCSGSKNLHDQVRLDKHDTKDFEAVFCLIGFYNTSTFV